jgi:diguanylate cyclase (GGDEF)-like protein
VNEGRIFYYVTKPWEPEELRAVVRNGLERHRLSRENRLLLERLRAANTELEEKVRLRTEEIEARNEELAWAKDRIEELLREDSLTGLANRRRLDEVLELEAAHARRYGTPLSAIMLDLDHFKQVNDEFGHPAGDAVLKAAAAVFAEGVRATDLAGRWGGEEFLIVLPHVRKSDAAVLAERLRGGLERAELPAIGRPMTASFGVAEWRHGGDSEAELVARADAAMYVAKRRGRNRVATEDDIEEAV